MRVQGVSFRTTSTTKETYNNKSAVVIIAMDCSPQVLTGFCLSLHEVLRIKVTIT